MQKTGKIKPPLTDLDHMPFGVHKGKLMQDVPTSYLHWFYVNCEAVPGFDSERVLNYILKSLNALKEEKRDLIWERKV